MVEVVPRAKPDACGMIRHLHGFTSVIADRLSGEQRAMAEMMRQCHTFHAIMVCTGPTKLGFIEWWRRLLYAGKSVSIDNQFQCLWCYRTADEHDDKALALRIIAGCNSDEPEYPPIPRHLVRNSDEGFEVGNLPIDQNFMSIEQLVAFYALATARAQQHEALTFDAANKVTHQSRVQSTSGAGFLIAVKMLT
ncbi:hypothetical protein EJ03DRAFT_122632 [Teratosphaeria nubilosa]|uniref:Uncharacterized protein n=1 Tax=Teratosphaeria nubilosa TaxID=161662 RepID=A0A6G1L5V1_9PEZI|nr:hypothetical protein EJ03DRAFT_122632 [Teratosphaeria nubilosa]